MGTKDIPVDSWDETQIENVRTSLARYPDYTVYASPLQRARETARRITGGLQTVTVDARLMERCLGEWQGQEKRKVAKSHPEVFPNGRMDFYYTPKNGEDCRNMVARIADFMIERWTAHENILVVTHNGVVKVMKSLLLGEKLASIFPIREPYLEPQSFTVSEERMEIIKANPFYTFDEDGHCQQWHHSSSP